jgi:hypothetical protein
MEFPLVDSDARTSAQAMTLLAQRAKSSVWNSGFRRKMRAAEAEWKRAA